MLDDSAPKHQPTPEQLDALARFKTGKPLKITAFAGAGKTTTLTLLANSRREHGMYLAFNKAIADESKLKFPEWVDCRTTHSLAYKAVMNAHRFSSGQMTGRTKPRQLTEQLALKRIIFANKFRLEGIHQAYLLLRTVTRFCQSDADKITLAHVPEYGRLMGLPEAIRNEVKAWTVREAEALWRRMINPRDGEMPLGYDGFLKLWALGRPRIAANYVMLDEAQDTNPAVLGVLREQSAQIVYVGDKHQQIYEWRGAVNAMEQIEGCEESCLSQSFRFGTAIGDAASEVIATLGETRRLRGTPSIRSTIAADGEANTVLARTNASVIKATIEALAEGRTPCIVGGTTDLKMLIGDVFNLKKGEPAVTPEFFGIESWDEVIAFSETEEGEELRMFVQLVEQYGERRLWWAISEAKQNESEANLIISTAHKAKGREWNAVRLCPDFLNSRLNPDDPNAEAEVRLFYVAMTRAKNLLIVDPEILDIFTTGRWRTVPRAEDISRAAKERTNPVSAMRVELVTSERPSQPPSVSREIAPLRPTPTNNGAEKRTSWRELVAAAKTQEVLGNSGETKGGTPGPITPSQDSPAAMPPLEIPSIQPRKKPSLLARLFGKK